MIEKFAAILRHHRVLFLCVIALLSLASTVDPLVAVTVAVVMLVGVLNSMKHVSAENIE